MALKAVHMQQLCVHIYQWGDSGHQCSNYRSCVLLLLMQGIPTEREVHVYKHGGSVYRALLVRC